MTRRSNTSSAVVQQRHEPHDSLDFFPTPPWATRAFVEGLAVAYPLHLYEVWEPACGEGDMARPLGEYFDRVYASDVHDYSATFPEQASVQDFLGEWGIPPRFADQGPDWIITNPPFRLASQFIDFSLRRATRGCAFLLRTGILEGKDRYRDLFSKTPPTSVLQFVERVPMFKGQLDPTGSKATTYCWLVWDKQDKCGFTQLNWIAPCRQRLERAADYQAKIVEPAPSPLFEGLGQHD